MTFKEFLTALVPVELFKGMSLTGGYFFKFQKKETVQYPEARLEPKDRFRGMFGYDSAISEVVNYARDIDSWMRNGGKAAIARQMGIHND